MATTTTTTLSDRDRAVLRAVAAGRCAFSGRTLVVDGFCFADQFAGPRLTSAGLIAAIAGTGRASLTDTGRALLPAA